jgi:hypothetical protein
MRHHDQVIAIVARQALRRVTRIDDEALDVVDTLIGDDVLPRAPFSWPVC